MSRRFQLFLRPMMLILIAILLIGTGSQANHTTAMATLITTPTSGPAPLTVNFTLALSPPSSSGCIADSYTLDFGDGTRPATGNSSGPLSVTHVYQNPGTFVAYLQYLMQANHGTPMTPDCQQGIAFTPVVITVLQPGAPATIDGKAVAAYRVLEQLHSKLSLAKAFADDLQNDSSESQSAKEKALGKLLLSADNLVQIALVQLEDLASQQQLAGSVLLAYINTIKERLSAESPTALLGIEILVEQALDALEENNLTVVIDALNDAERQSNSARDNWRYWETSSQFKDIFTCSDGTAFYYSTQIGTPGHEELYGTDSHDVINSLGGDDHINSGGGDDVLCGGEGYDYLEGGSGNDLLIGGPGPDDLYGEEGVDVLNGGSGPDLLHGGSGNDTLQGGTESDLISGEEGDDILMGGAGHDFLDGGDGHDTLDSSDGEDLLAGGGGNDTLTAGSGGDILDGGEGSDQLSGNDGDDILFGGPENDTLRGGNDDDQLFGEAGNDTLIGAESQQADGSERDECDGGSGSGDSGQFCDTAANIP